MKNESLLITSNFSNNTGYAWNFFFRLFNVIARRAVDNSLGITLSFATVVQPVKILDPDIPFSVFQFDPLFLGFKNLKELRENIKKNNVKYCYLTDFPSWHWLYYLMRIWGIKKIVVHNHLSVATPYLIHRTKGLKLVLKSLIQKSKKLTADVVYTCSEFSKKNLVQVACCPDHKIKIIHHGINTDRFICDNKKYDVAMDKFIIFTVARSVRDKGIHVLIEATKLLKEKFQLNNFVVKYGGTGPELDDFKEMVKQYGLTEHFIFLGYLDDTKENTCEADIVVVPSCWGDAFPLSVIEAMAAGKPIIATDVGGIPEQIGNEQCGVLIKPNDSNMLADEIANLLNDADRRKQLSINSRKRAEEMFDEKRFYNEVLSCLMKDLNIMKSSDK